MQINIDGSYQRKIGSVLVPPFSDYVSVKTDIAVTTSQDGTAPSAAGTKRQSCAVVPWWYRHLGTTN